MKDIFQILKDLGDRKLTMCELQEIKQKMIAAGVPKALTRDLFAGALYGMGAARLEQILKEKLWLRRIEALRPGDACEVFKQLGPETDERGYFKWDWVLATIRRNGGSYYWRVVTEADLQEFDTYIEHIRLPGQTEAWPGRGSR